MVMNNNNPGSTSPLSIEIRSSLIFGTAIQYQTADNGVLYVIDAAIAPPPTILKALDALKCTKFAEMIKKAGLSTFIDQLVDVTVYVFIVFM